MPITIDTYWCVRLKSLNGRSHVFCKFQGQSRLQFRQWLEDNLQRLKDKYGADCVALRVTTSDGMNRPYNHEKD